MSKTGFIKLVFPKSSEFTAGSETIVIFDYVAGESGIKTGGKLKIVFPYACVVSWQIGEIVSTTNAKAKTGERISYIGTRRYPYAEIVVEEGKIKKNQKIRVIFGNVSRMGPPTLVQPYSQSNVEFEVSVDVKGNGHYEKVNGPGKFKVEPDIPNKFIVSSAATPSLKEKTNFNIAGVDRNGNLCGTYQAEPQITVKEIETGRIVKKSGGRAKNGKSLPKAFFIKSKGRYEMEVIDEKSNLKGLSNPIAINFLDKDRKIFFGDFHFHTGIARIPHDVPWDVEDAYAYAKDVMGLDFAGIADHLGMVLKDKHWKKEKQAAKKYYKPGEFVTFLGYERDNYKTAHIGVHFLRGGKPLPPARNETPADFWQASSSDNVLTVAHHPNGWAERMAFQENEAWGNNYDWQYQNDEFQPLVEICQERGICEKDSFLNAPANLIRTSLGGSSVQYALSLGHKIGFVGSSDSHLARPGFKGVADWGQLEGGPLIGLTGVVSKELTRESLWDSFKKRKTYATTGEKILCYFEINGHSLGDIVKINPRDANFSRRITVKALGTTELEKIEIIRNNLEIFTYQCQKRHADFEYTDDEKFKSIPQFKKGEVFYYVKIKQRDGNMAFLSPIWFVEGL